MRNLIDIIGKSIWVLVDNCGNRIYHLDKSGKRIVVGIIERGHNLPDGSVNDDWCSHIVYQNEDGTISHCREYEAVICPEQYDDECSVVSRFLSDNRCYADEVYRVFAEIPVICVEISWGGLETRPRLVRFPYGLSWLHQNRGAGNRRKWERLLFLYPQLHQGIIVPTPERGDSGQPRLRQSCR